MDTETLQTLISLYELTRVRTLLMQARNTALLYYYATTFNEEVEHIWPQPTCKAGKLLFLTARYTTIVGIAVTTARSTPNHANIGIEGCTALLRIDDVVRPIAGTSAEALLWICLYALLEGKRKYFYLLMGTFTGLTIPIQILTWIDSARTLSIPPTLLGNHLGYPCAWDVSKSSPKLTTAMAYLTLARAVLGLLFGVVALARRFQKHNSLLTVILREGGIYYCTTCILIFLNALFITPGFPVCAFSLLKIGGSIHPSQANDKYQIVSLFGWLCMLIFSDRLLLKLQTAHRPETRVTVSELVFAPDKSETTATGQTISSNGSGTCHGGDDFRQFQLQVV